MHQPVAIPAPHAATFQHLHNADSLSNPCRLQHLPSPCQLFRQKYEYRHPPDLLDENLLDESRRDESLLDKSLVDESPLDQSLPNENLLNENLPNEWASSDTWRTIPML